MSLRFGLCCLFRNEDVRFRTTTAAALSKMSRKEARAKVSSLCLENARNLGMALRAVRRLGIGAFRISSNLFPRATHPDVGYHFEELPAGGEIIRLLSSAGNFRKRHGIRLSFHPDQFIVLSSPRDDVVEKSLRELEHHGRLAALTGADVINIHAGGVYGDRDGAVARFINNYSMLSARVRRRLTVENDERLYSVRHLLPLCSSTGIPLVYDVHHHRCFPDGMGEDEATEAAAETWGAREPLFHVSSPRAGWGSGGDPRPHADYIDIEDFPRIWAGRDITVDVEAKAKELAVVRLMKDLRTDRTGRRTGHMAGRRS